LISYSATNELGSVAFNQAILRIVYLHLIQVGDNAYEAAVGTGTWKSYKSRNFAPADIKSFI
jgi:hypothetical protein